MSEQAQELENVLEQAQVLEKVAEQVQEQENVSEKAQELYNHEETAGGWNTVIRESLGGSSLWMPARKEAGPFCTRKNEVRNEVHTDIGKTTKVLCLDRCPVYRT